MVNDVIYAAEVVGSFNDIVHVHRFICDADCVGFKDVSGLLVCEFAAFDVVGVVCEVNLCTVVDASAELRFFFFSKAAQKGRAFFFCAFWDAGICRYVPSFAC